MGLETSRTRIPRFDRTGSDPTDVYVVGPSCQVFDHDIRKEIVWELQEPCPTDPYTARIGLTRFPETDRVLLWGEFESGERAWIRYDDPVARRWYVQCEFIFEGRPEPPQCPASLFIEDEGSHQQCTLPEGHADEHVHGTLTWIEGF